MSGLFKIRGLTKRYGDRTVLDRIDLDLERGEGLALLGRSGTGKSVLLRQLNGLEAPSEGTIEFDGQCLSSLDERQLAPIRRRVAMLFQSGALFDSMTVFGNIAFPLLEHTDMDEDEVRECVAEKLRRVGLEGIEDRMPSQLSGGMRKRVALARSLALDPEVVLFDEPSTGLDPMTAASIASLIESARRDLGVTCVVVTHDLPLARRTGQRVAYLHESKFRFIGTWAEAEASDDRHLHDFLEGREENHAA
ncbi:MAG: ATP-binding cassette domain-containing protein [Acidobacteria bacterium]|nr:MAG: ATP-binding cassette domain-containing protein [Acidobacteriota bacterium]REK11644.1 MAG: ATP-binding cassette domain-containing protein [Acidobacteriota bacterium]